MGVCLLRDYVGVFMFCFVLVLFYFCFCGFEWNKKENDRVGM